MNALILHIPRGFSHAAWKHNHICTMPMGVFSIANFARSHGHNVMVMNASGYRNRENALGIILARIRQHDFRVIGLPIHWHFTGYDVLYVVDEIKKAFPSIKTVIGGLTASIYAREFLAKSSSLDAVIQGDGELPFLKFIEELDKEEPLQNLSSVPNLYWRKDSEILFNGLTYATSEEEYSSLDFSISGSIFEIDEYQNGGTTFDALAGKGEELSEKEINERLFFLNIGRGCSYNCVYCAGSRLTFEKYFKRPRPIVRPVNSVLKTVEDSYRCGFRKFHICFDPFFKGKDEYFITLFKKMRAEIGDDISICFEHCDLPTNEFIDTCACSFVKTMLTFSPCFFMPAIRKRFKGYSFTISELKERLKYIARYGNLETFIYFALTRLDSWDRESLQANIATMQELKREFKSMVAAVPIIAEPGSPWLSFAEHFGIQPDNIAFDDFWENWKTPFDRIDSKMCYRFDSVNDIFDEISSAMGRDVLTAY
jgi:hypothetical protein